MSEDAGVEIPLNSVDSHVGARLRTRRLLVRMSERWLASFLEISVDELCAIEEGRARIGYDDLLKVAEVIGVPERYFYQSGSGGGGSEAELGPSWLREVDRWFRDHIAPHEGLFLKVAKHLIGNRESARDLVHDAYAAVLSDDHWRSVQDPKAFMRQTVKNLALDLLRRNKVVPMDQYADIEQFGLLDLAPDAFQSVSDRERLRTVMAAIDKLPRQCRQVFVMRRIEDMPPKEIASRLGIALATVEGHLARGMSEVHRHLETQVKVRPVRLISNQKDDGDTAPRLEKQ